LFFIAAAMMPELFWLGAKKWRGWPNGHRAIVRASWRRRRRVPELGALMICRSPLRWLDEKLLTSATGAKALAQANQTRHLPFVANDDQYPNPRQVGKKISGMMKARWAARL